MTSTSSVASDEPRAQAADPGDAAADPGATSADPPAAAAAGTVLSAAEAAREQRGLVVRASAEIARENAEFDMIWRWGRLCAASGMFPDARQNEAAAAVKILAGRELGFGTVASMSQIYIMDGKPVLGAGLMAQAVKRSGKYDYRVLEHDDTICRIQFYEYVDGRRVEIGVASFSEEDAVRAELGRRSDRSPNTPTVWEKYPRNMLFARAMSNGVAFYAPDVFEARVYTPSEIRPDGEYDADGNPTSFDFVPPAPPFVANPVDEPRGRPAGRSRRTAPADVAPEPAAAPSGGRQRRAARGPLEIGEVRDVQTLLLWQWDKFQLTTAEVAAALDVSGVGEIAEEYPVILDAAEVLWQWAVSHKGADPEAWEVYRVGKEIDGDGAEDVPVRDVEDEEAPPDATATPAAE